MCYKIMEVADIFKKTPAVIIAFILLLILINACNRTPQQSPSTETPAVSSAPIEATPSAEPSPKTSPSPDAETSTGLKRGTWNDGVYSNEFAKLTFTLPEGWVAATDEQVASLMGQSADLFGDEQKWMVESAKLTSIYDMMVQDPITGNNMLVMFENLSMSVGGLGISEKDYLEIASAQMAQMEGMDYSFNEPYDTIIGGDTYVTVRADEANNGFSQYYLMHKQDKYMTGLIITLVDDTSIDDILAQFE